MTGIVKRKALWDQINFVLSGLKLNGFFQKNVFKLEWCTIFNTQVIRKKNMQQF